MNALKTSTFVCALVVLLASVGCQTMSGLTKGETTMGQGGTVVTKSLTRCQKPLGTAALLEDDSQFTQFYAQLGLTSPIPLVKIMMSESGCFQVVNRGATGAALRAERELAAEGQLREGSNMGGGQMIAADYIIQAEIIHKDANAGGGGAAVASALPGLVGIIAGGFKKTKLEAQVMLTLTDVRSGLQLAVVDGSATKSDMAFAGAVFGSRAGGVGGVYESTDIGKVTAVAFMDAHNKLVQKMQVYTDNR